jgi:hypothetical protein
MLCWAQILGVCVARASVTAIRGLPRVEGPSDFGFNPVGAKNLIRSAELDKVRDCR